MQRSDAAFRRWTVEHKAENWNRLLAKPDVRCRIQSVAERSKAKAMAELEHVASSLDIEGALNYAIGMGFLGFNLTLRYGGLGPEHAKDYFTRHLCRLGLVHLQERKLHRHTYYEPSEHSVDVDCVGKSIPSPKQRQQHDTEYVDTDDTDDVVRASFTETLVRFRLPDRVLSFEPNSSLFLTIPIDETLQDQPLRFNYSRLILGVDLSDMQGRVVCKLRRRILFPRQLGLLVWRYMFGLIV